MAIAFIGVSAVAQSVKFDGTTDAVMKPDSSKFSFAGAKGASFTMWVKSDWGGGFRSAPYLFQY